MLFLLFELGRDRYALDALQVAEVLPLLALKEMPLAPPGVAGLLNYMPYIGALVTMKHGPFILRREYIV